MRNISPHTPSGDLQPGSPQTELLGLQADKARSHIEQDECCPVSSWEGGSSFLIPDKTASRLLDSWTSHRCSSSWSERPADRWNLRPAVWNPGLVQIKEPHTFTIEMHTITDLSGDHCTNCNITCPLSFCVNVMRLVKLNCNQAFWNFWNWRVIIKQLPQPCMGHILETHRCP